MSWLSQALGLDSRPASASAPSFDWAKWIKEQKEASDKAAADKKLSDDQAAYTASVQNAAAAVSKNPSSTSGQLASIDSQVLANDAASSGAAKGATTPASGYQLQQSSPMITAAPAAAPRVNPNAQYQASQPQNQVGSASNLFTTPNIQGLTFGGG